ncbi:hypothetical protein [Nicoliella lavandulae]|uniref:DNA-binding protein n=1 Tax=Nicoliella lavandulae TaxID=3082954 RepID=A0ABU8SM59_9LACO
MEAKLQVDDSTFQDELRSMFQQAFDEGRQSAINADPFIHGKANLAKWLKFGSAKVNKMIELDKLPYHEVQGKKIFLKQEVIEFIKSR